MEEANLRTNNSGKERMTEMDRPKVGVQLIVYGQRWREDMAGVLQEVAAAGFEGAETGALDELYSIEDFSKWLSDNGLKWCGVHVGFDSLKDESTLKTQIEWLKRVGAKYLICSGVGSVEGIETYEKAAEVFNGAGEQCKDAGLTFCYHNHAWEFQQFDGTKGIHRLAELTDAEVVKLCVDVYWVHIGGEDPAEFIARYADRACYFHFKDGGDGWFTELGKGEVNLPSALDAALKCSPDWIVYEQDRTEKSPAESLKESRNYLQSIGL